MPTTGANLRLPTTVQTERLVLRSVCAADIPALVSHLSDWDVARWLARTPHPYTEADGKAWFRLVRQIRRKRLGLPLNVVRLEDKAVIGGTGLEFSEDQPEVAEVGYWIGKPFWRQGYGREVLLAMLNTGFGTLNVQRITAHVLPDNLPSQSLLAAHGFTVAGEAVHDFRGEAKQVTLYVLTRAVWQEMTGA